MDGSNCMHYSPDARWETCGGGRSRGNPTVPGSTSKMARALLPPASSRREDRFRERGAKSARSNLKRSGMQISACNPPACRAHWVAERPKHELKGLDRVHPARPCHRRHRHIASTSATDDAGRHLALKSQNLSSFSRLLHTIEDLNSPAKMKSRIAAILLTLILAAALPQTSSAVDSPLPLTPENLGVGERSKHAFLKLMAADEVAMELIACIGTPIVLLPLQPFKGSPKSSKPRSTASRTRPGETCFQFKM